MTVSELIAELQALPAHLPVKVLMRAVWVNVPWSEQAECMVPAESEAGPIDTVRAAGGYVLIKGE